MLLGLAHVKAASKHVDEIDPCDGASGLIYEIELLTHLPFFFAFAMRKRKPNEREINFLLKKTDGKNGAFKMRKIKYDLISIL